MLVGDLGANPGNIPGANVDSIGQVFISACSGVVERIPGTGRASMPRSSGPVFGSCEDG